MSTGRDSDGLLRLVLIVAVVLVLAPLLMMAVMVPLVGVWGGMMGGFGGGMGLGAVGLSLVWLLVLVGAGYLAYRWLGGSGGAGTDPAVEELRLAYARGELTDEEYEERRSRLEEP